MPINPAIAPVNNTDSSARIAFRIGGGTHFMPAGQIRYVSLVQGIPRVALENELLSVNERLGSIEKRLPAGRFLRISRSTLVNLNWVQAFKPRSHGDQTIFLPDGVELVVSRTRRRAFLAALKLKIADESEPASS
ncbi:MAG TPA: LytTR family DNA-binding domain-containing protein [Candidatus Limnocylindria bacterium]|jgi:DNA-binding LytR/AlgR family response regulator|nr:LytTR family DNA-binding domain-containing protein [Candidatus Limnocylindria bacterium]